MKVSYAIVFVSDMSKSVAFYRDELAFRFASNLRTGPSSRPTVQRWHYTRARGRGPSTSAW
jgi:catechol 2,3-dioxygenase-like lactoylglutathione lyase family enzyme